MASIRNVVVSRSLGLGLRSAGSLCNWGEELAKPAVFRLHVQVTVLTNGICEKLPRDVFD